MTKPRTEYPQEIIDHINNDLTADFDTGEIFNDGNPVGSLSRGYYQLKIKSFTMKRFRILWYMKYGYFSDKQIDHINGNSQDDRIDNLREVTGSFNSRNKSCLGYSITSNWKFTPIITYRLNDKSVQIRLGNFLTPQEAQDVFLKKRIEMFGDELVPLKEIPEEHDIIGKNNLAGIKQYKEISPKKILGYEYDPLKKKFRGSLIINNKKISKWFLSPEEARNYYIKLVEEHCPDRKKYPFKEIPEEHVKIGQENLKRGHGKRG